MALPPEAPRPAPVSQFTSQRPEPHSISKRLLRNSEGELIIFATRDHFSVELFTVSPPMTLAIGRTSADPAGRGERGRFRRRHRNRLPGCAAHTRSGLALEGDGQTVPPEQSNRPEENVMRLSDDE